jgi:glycosyltransferase involved in cell wall biosynthesis
MSAGPTVPPGEMRLVELGMHFDATRGGADRYFAALLQGLGGTGVRCTAAAFGGVPAEVSLPHRLVSLGPADAPLPVRLGRLHRFGNSFPRGETTVLAWHFGLYGLACLWGAADTVPVAHFHGPWAAESAEDGQNALVVAAKRVIERRALRRARRVVVLSEAFRKFVVGEFSIDPARVAVVPPALDLGHFAPTDAAAARERLGWPSGGKIVLCVRRMVKRMGIGELIRAWGAVAPAFPGALLVLAGDGPLRGELEAMAAGSAVRFTGRLDDDLLPAAYAGADFSIVPSRTLEGFGLVAAESLACGTPAVVTPVGGLPEVVRDLDPRLVLDSPRRGSLQEGLRRCLSPGVALPGRGACRAFAGERFSSGRFTRDILRVYREAAGS